MMLVFNQTRLPRTMTRSQWREIDRWRRKTTKTLARAVQQEIDMLVVYGSTVPSETRERMLDRLINPPVMVGPYGI